jgi:hypothetical protein
VLQKLMSYFVVPPSDTFTSLPIDIFDSLVAEVLGLIMFIFC